MIASPNRAAINFNNGLALSGTGVVNLGSGSLSINDTVSGITSGSLTAANQFVGDGSMGQFTQSGGSNTLFAATSISATTAVARTT